MKTFLITASLVFSMQTYATPAKKADVSVSDARIFAPIKGSNATAGYGKFTNETDKPVKFVIEKAEPFKAVELHETLEKDGRMAMQKVEEVSIPAHQSLELKPGGQHIMLFDAGREVKTNETLKVTFKVNGKSQSFDFKVIPRSETSSEEHHHH